MLTPSSPYKLEAPWKDFEFAYHALDSDSNVIIVSMAWQTLQNPAQYLQNPLEPDLDTLVYWVQRFEPLVRSNNEDEIIFVFCNRTGTEYDATYTGTSAVLGVKLGEVFVYGVLGRGETELLIVDTSQPPRMKLTDADEVAAESAANELDIEPESENELAEPNWPLPGTSFEVAPGPVPGPTVQTATVPEPLTHQPQVSRPKIEISVHTSPRSATSPRLPWLAPPENEAGSPVHSQSPSRLQIPPIASRTHTDNYTSLNSVVTDIALDTPGFPPSPAFLLRPPRPKLTIPSSASRYQSKPSPYPWNYGENSSTLFTSGACMTPITPFDEDGWIGTPIDPKPSGWFWRHEPTLSALKESVQEEEEEEERQVTKPKPENDKPELQEEGYSMGVEEVKKKTTERSERSEDTGLQGKIGESSVGTKEATLASVTETVDELRLHSGSTSTSENTLPTPGDGPALPSSSDNLPSIDDTQGHDRVTSSNNPQPATADASSQAQFLKENTNRNGSTAVHTLAYRRVSKPRPASWAGPICNTTRGFAITSKTLHIKQPFLYSAQVSGASQQQHAGRIEPDSTMEDEDLLIFDDPPVALHTTASTMTPTSSVPTTSEPSLTTSSLSTADDSIRGEGTSALQRVQGLFFRKKDGQQELGHECEDDDGDSGYGNECSNGDGYKTERDPALSHNYAYSYSQDVAGKEISDGAGADVGMKGSPAITGVNVGRAMEGDD